MAKFQRALRTFDTASLTGNFQAVGVAVPFTTTDMTIINPSDVGILIGDLSTQEDIRIPAGAVLSIGQGYSQQGNPPAVIFETNVILQIKQVTAAGTGTIIIQLFG